VILLLALVLGGLLGLAAGGRVAGLANLRLRGESVLIGLLVLQGALPLLSSGGLDKRVLYWAWAATFPAMAVVCLLNAKTPGMAVASAGLALNAAVVLLNHGMPVSPAAVVVAGGTVEMLRNADFAHNAVSAVTRLTFIADVLPIPGPTGVRGVASAGDLLLACGVAGTVGWALREAVGGGSGRLGPAPRVTSRPRDSCRTTEVVGEDH
jgi:hypothetical protein